MKGFTGYYKAWLIIFTDKLTLLGLQHKTVLQMRDELFLKNKTVANVSRLEVILGMCAVAVMFILFQDISQTLNPKSILIPDGSVFEIKTRIVSPLSWALDGLLTFLLIQGLILRGWYAHRMTVRQTAKEATDSPQLPLDEVIE